MIETEQQKQDRQENERLREDLFFINEFGGLL